MARQNFIDELFFFYDVAGAHKLGCLFREESRH